MRLSKNSSKKIFIASDHAGFRMKEYIISQNPHLFDLGTHSEDSVDYPNFAKKLCDSLKNELNSFGILICGSGIGMSIAANRYPHVRAALCYNIQAAKLAREHNDANVLVIGARFMKQMHDSVNMLNTFLQTSFEEGRHSKRVEKL